jgi:ribosomal protein S18 acetylase RimI-like enzyme
MSATTVVTEAIEADLTSIELLIVELLDALENRPALDAATALENCRILLKDPTHHLLVARVDGAVAGFINFTSRRTIVHERPSGLIDELVVAQRYRTQGIGTRLVRAAVEACRKLGCCEVEVTTEVSNRIARDFYKARGFEETGILLEKHLEDSD